MSSTIRLVGPRLVRSHGQTVTPSVRPLRKTAPAVPALVTAAVTAPALAHMSRLRAELATRAVELARDQLEANTAALEQLCSAPDWAAMVAILNEHAANTTARFAEAVQFQIQLVVQVAERLAVPG